LQISFQTLFVTTSKNIAQKTGNYGGNTDYLLRPFHKLVLDNSAHFSPSTGLNTIFFLAPPKVFPLDILYKITPLSALSNCCKSSFKASPNVYHLAEVRDSLISVLFASSLFWDQASDYSVIRN
jgi:hypothetical protein